MSEPEIPTSLRATIDVWYSVFNGVDDVVGRGLLRTAAGSLWCHLAAEGELARDPPAYARALRAIADALTKLGATAGIPIDDAQSIIAAERPAAPPAAKARESRKQKKLRKKSEPTNTDAAWIEDCQTDGRGDYRGNLLNVLTGLRRDPLLAHLFAYDELFCGPVLLAPVPGQPEDDARYPRPVTDFHANLVQEFLQERGLESIGISTMHQAIDTRAGEQPFHPAREYLDGQEWDGVPRLKNWAATYLGTAANAYTQGVGTMFMVSMVARIYWPGCKVDHMLVIEGPQGRMKSAACRVLGGAWFSDHLPDIAHGGKDVSQHLRGKWLMEIAEMQAMNRAASAGLKAFITRDTERYRPSFGRKEAVEPRQCVFVGTTNMDSYLRDETGARRYWPLATGITGPIQIDALTRDRDQLFAEAVAEFEAGTPWWPDAAFEQEHARPEQEKRYEADAWEEPIEEYLTTLRHSATKEQGNARTTLGEVAQHALKFESRRLGISDQRRITAALKRLGWVRENPGGTSRPGRGSRRWWVSSDETIAAEIEI
jgi:hypothetical protein